MTSHDAEMPPRPPLPDTPPPVGTIEFGDDPSGVPMLAELADLCDAVDRCRARTVVLLARVVHQPEILDGLSPQVWLEHVCRYTAAEARRLLATADTLAHLPSVVTGLADGRLSWSQAVGIARAARTVPTARRGELDQLIAAGLDAFRRFGPDQWSTGWGRSASRGSPAGSRRNRPPPNGPNTSR